MRTFVFDLFNAHGDEIGMESTQELRSIFQKYIQPEHDNILTVAKALKVRIHIVGKSGATLEEHGEGPHLVLNNEGSVDGAGKVVSHFRYVWYPANDEERPEQEYIDWAAWF